ncbi:polysaccharide pyruvyl transferase family protein [Alteribacillus sp. HJP-4]|uniref:polysaccharide pyruvyl transferase family protein n=1 Tax=Alteribacillus sp. HJP-4 TaxID=2775394 RepID=UPI0035CD122C
MNVGIIGNYGNNNNGDEAILSGLLHQLTSVGDIKKENIVVFSNNPVNTKQRHGVAAFSMIYKEGNIVKSVFKTVRESRKVMQSLDLLIIGGGGLLMDMYKRDAPLYCVLGLTGKYSGCRVAVHGVGAGPITTRPGTFFIKKLTHAAATVAVRDERSKQLLQDIGVKKEVSVINDPAFSIPVQTPHQKSRSIQNVGVTAVPYFSKRYWPFPDEPKYRKYVYGMAVSLDELVSKKGVNITFFSTKYPEDIEVTKDIAVEMKHSEAVTILEDNFLPGQLTNLAGNQDLVIGTRLHSLILAVNAATPVIGIEYHQKVKDFMSAIDKPDYSVPIEDSMTGIVAAFEKAEADWEQLQANFVKTSAVLREEAREGIRLLGLST